jgi:hypothetical protein
VLAAWNDGTEQAIIRLVLESVLEISFGQGEAFVCASKAAPLLVDQRNHRSSTKISEISEEAIAYADSLPNFDIEALSARLYFYNRRPPTPSWHHRLPASEALDRFLRITSPSRTFKAMSRDWALVPSAPRTSGWKIWKAKRQAQSTSRDQPTYKLYVSPEPADLPEAFGAVVDVLAGSRASTFKVGSDLFGVLRPDKLVVYFDSFDDLRYSAEKMTSFHEHWSSHGVPFTAQIGDTPFLSWGIDPPRGISTARLGLSESWRLWIVTRIATGLISARQDGVHGDETRPFLRKLLENEGVDFHTWAPSHSMWRNLRP